MSKGMSMGNKVTYPPQAITSKNDEMLCIGNFKSIDIRACNKTNLQTELSLRLQIFASQ